MHLYKQFFKQVSKNKIGIIIYAAIMLVMIVVISFVSYNNFEDPVAGEDSEEIPATSYSISYVDNDDSELSRALIEYLSIGNTVTDYSSMSDEKVSDMVYFAITTFHLDIPEDFQKNVDNDEDTSIYYRSFVTGSSYIYRLKSQTSAFLEVYRTFRLNGYDASTAIEKTKEALDSEVSISVHSTDGKETGITAKEFCIYEGTLFFTYISLGMLVLSVGAAVIKSNSEALSNRIEAGPVSVAKRTLINSLGIYSCGVILVIIYAAIIYIFGGNTTLVKEKGLLLVLSTLITVLYNCSITAFISAFNVKQNVLSMLANIVSLSMSFLCGVFVPQWLLGDTVNSVGKFFPFHWTVKSLNMIYPAGGSGLEFDAGSLCLNFAVEVLFAIAFVCLAVMIKKMRSRQK